MYVYVDKYTVKSGDTLSSIAKRHGLLSYTQILRVNPDIENPDLIRPGQVINVPKQVPMGTYIVKAGDTLGNIVYNYNREHKDIYGTEITFDEVLAYNPRIINPDMIYPGMVIYLPEIL